MENIIKLHSYIAKLKKEKRTGWTRFLNDVESVADHSFGVSLLTFVIAKELNYDVNHCIKLSLVHDLAESITKDITPYDMKREDKINLEIDAINKIAKETGFDFIKDLAIEEFEGKTKESQLVHDVDKIEMVLQALDYEKNHGKNLSEFFDYTKSKLELDYSKELFQKIIQKRPS
jgi:putative hydrolases of HD superfamily